MPLWTQRAKVTWRPLVAFLEQRARILRDLEESQLLRRFTISDQRISIDILDPHHFLTFGPSSIDIVALKPDADMNSLEAAADCIWAALEPGAAKRVTFSFQFVTKCQGSYDEVREEAGNQMFSWPGETRNVDFAIIGDIAEDNLGAESHFQAGIVERQEAGMRLANAESSNEPGREISPNLFPGASLPAVALYNVQTWRIAEPSADTRSDIFSLWSRARDCAEKIDASLHERLVGSSK